MTKFSCEGWWEQDGFGRQPMQQLCLSFEGGKLQGSGEDMIGPFTLSGELGEAVVIVKQYLGKHRVDYVGRYDGEGTFWGTWHIDPFYGDWMIKVTSRIPDDAKGIDEAE